jgi:hypothetical protein
MPDRLDILAFRSGAKLPRDEEDMRRIRALVHMASRDDDAPFDRLIDYWFAAVAWAAWHNLPLPENDSGGKEFVEIGRGSSEFITLEPWRIDLLNALYLLSQPAFLADPFDPSALDTTAGRFGDHGPIGGSDVIKNANRYALAGAMPMWDSFVGAHVDATKHPKQLAAAAKLNEITKLANAAFLMAFASASRADGGESLG